MVTRFVNRSKPSCDQTPDAAPNQSISQLRETSRQRLAVAREVVKLTNLWAAEKDTVRRGQLAVDPRRLYLKDVTRIPLGQYQIQIAYRGNLTGVIPAPALF